MKKFLALVGILTCIFGLTACGEAKSETEYERYKITAAQNKAQTMVVPTILALLEDPTVSSLDEYTAEEVAYSIYSISGGLEVDGNAFRSALSSFASATAETGDIVAVKSCEAVIDGEQIVVTVELQGANKDADAEVIFTNDFFMTLKSAALNPKSTLGDSMKKAGMNTLLGMGTVFAVLILIALIIACFGVIPKIQASFDAKKKEEKKNIGIDNAVAQITGLEENAGAGDDLELVAVIAAAIAASEGAAGTDGFVVRSIKRRRAY